MSSRTAYNRIFWEIENVNPNSRYLQSDNFNVTFGSYELEWNATFYYKITDKDFQYGGGVPLENAIEDDLDEERIASDEKTSGVFLSLSNLSITPWYYADDDDPKCIVKYKIYAVDNDQDEKLLCSSNLPLGNFAEDLEWGGTFSIKYLLDKKNNFVENDAIAFVIILEIHEFKACFEAGIYKDIFNNKLCSDFKIICTDRNIPVHRAVLLANSPVFKKMFETPMKESRKNEVIIDDIDGKIVFEMIRFMYTGEVESMKDHAEDLIYAADKYEFKALKEKCIESLSFHLNINHVFQTLFLADRFGAEILFENGVTFLQMQKDKILKSAHGTTFTQDGNKIMMKILIMENLVQEHTLYSSST